MAPECLPGENLHGNMPPHIRLADEDSDPGLQILNVPRHETGAAGKPGLWVVTERRYTS